MSFCSRRSLSRRRRERSDALFAELQLGTTETISAKSKDGSEVHGLLTTPAGYAAGTKIPMLLRIHGGPNGQDQYIIQYDYEIGPPWDPKAWETYQKISYPFLHADRIKTPTLFLGGEKDFNVPVQGGQQMYQALRSLNIDTQLVIYPNEFHGITRPSYVRDRYECYLAWYEKYINGKTPTTTTAQDKQ